MRNNKKLNRYLRRDERRRQQEDGKQARRAIRGDIVPDKYGDEEIEPRKEDEDGTET